MVKLDLPEQPQDGENPEAEEAPSDFPFRDDGILITTDDAAILVMGRNLSARIRKILSILMQNAFRRGSPLRIDIPRGDEADSNEIKLRPGSREISMFAYRDTISKPC
jgi:hypothetical protein